LLRLTLTATFLLAMLGHPGLTEQAAAQSTLASTTEKPIKNIILLIGDGMGPQQIGLLLSYAHLATESEVPNRTPAIEQLAEQGRIALVRTEPHGALVVDSAAAATQLATGQKAGSEMIGLNYLGDRAPTVLEIAKQQGKSTGLVSDTRITHATPAAFAAHQPHRSRENEIAVDLLENQVDVLLSGGARHWLPQMVNNRQSAAYASAVQMTAGRINVSSKRHDNRNLLLEARNDYQLVFDRFSLSGLQQGRVLGLFANSEMSDAMAERQNSKAGNRSQPTLAEMTSKSLELLSQNQQGFFLMVEGGQIDWAGHNNDAGTLLQEMLRFDRAVHTVLQWAKTRQDTLVLLTADHETGGFGLSYSGSPLPEPRQLTGAGFAGQKFAPHFNFAARKKLDQLAAQKKSYYQIFQEFDALSKAERTPEKLKEIVNLVTSFQITTADAVAILTREMNRQHQADHKFLGSHTVPKVDDFSEFYVYGENSRMNLLGRKLAAQQNTVWATGTHTNTPVLLIAYGPAPATERFQGMLHSTDVGRKLIHLVRGN